MPTQAVSGIDLPWVTRHISLPNPSPATVSQGKGHEAHAEDEQRLGRQELVGVSWWTPMVSPRKIVTTLINSFWAAARGTRRRRLAQEVSRTSDMGPISGVSMGAAEFIRADEPRCGHDGERDRAVLEIGLRW